MEGPDREGAVGCGLQNCRPPKEHGDKWKLNEELMALAEFTGLMIHRGDKSRVNEARCGLENDAHAFGSIVRKPEHEADMGAPRARRHCSPVFGWR
jgi:hypothetical protein